MPSFRLVHTSGEDLGVRRFGDVPWKPGDTIPVGDGGVLRVVEVAWAGEDEVAGTLTVVVAEV